MEKKAIIRRDAFNGMTIEKIVFLDSVKDAPPYTLDLSVNEDRSVIGWKDFDGRTMYVAPTYGNKIIANKYCFHMFSIRSLKEIVGLENFDTLNVTDMSFMFSGCESLTSLDLSNFNTSNVENMNFMFSRCKKLMILDISNFDTSNVSSMIEMFAYCRNLKQLDVSSFNTSKVVNMYKMFAYCNSIASLDLSNFDTSRVRDINGIFYECLNLERLNISIDCSANCDITHMFTGCQKLKLIINNFDD